MYQALLYNNLCFLIGHKSLVQAAILHRDNSENNILLSLKDEAAEAAEGRPGFLLDSDSACLLRKEGQEDCGLWSSPREKDVRTASPSSPLLFLAVQNSLIVDFDLS